MIKVFWFGEEWRSPTGLAARVSQFMNQRTTFTDLTYPYTKLNDLLREHGIRPRDIFVQTPNGWRYYFPAIPPNPDTTDPPGWDHHDVIEEAPLP